MAKEQHPNSRANIEKHKLKKGLPTSEQREIQAKGTRASVKARQQYASLKEAALDMITFDEAMEILLKRVKAGNLKAWEIYMKVSGQEPASKVETTNTDIVIELGGEYDKADD